MSKECLIEIYSVFNDRGSVNRVLNERITVDASQIIPSQPLEGWKFCGAAPVVKYYDGECLEVEFPDTDFKASQGERRVTLWSDPVELYNVAVSNPQVHESEQAVLSLQRFAKVGSTDMESMFMRGSYSAMVCNFFEGKLFADKTAVRYFMFVCMSASNMFLLNTQAVDTLRVHAAKGDKYAQFALGLYHYYVNPDEDSLDKSYDLLSKGDAQGFSPATAALSQMYRFGEVGMVDRSKAARLLDKAFAQGCPYAAKIRLKQIIFREAPQNLPVALDILEGLLKDDPHNPMWHYLKGHAIANSESYGAARDEFEYAAMHGVNEAWFDYAVSCSHNESNECVDKETYHRILQQGLSRRSGTCLWALAMDEMQDFDAEALYSSFTAQRIVDNLRKAFLQGEILAAYYLGNIYYYGEIGIEEDDALAWEWYAKGALHACAFSCEAMYDMACRGYGDCDRDFIDQLALRGARYGSKRLLNETVIAYTQGRLTAFAAEIEQYYVPVFDRGDGEPEDDSDELPDDDGRFDAYV